MQRFCFLFAIQRQILRCVLTCVSDLGPNFPFCVQVRDPFNFFCLYILNKGPNIPCGTVLMRACQKASDYLCYWHHNLFPALYYSPIHKAAGSSVTGRSLQNGKMSMGNRHTERPPDPILYGGRPSGGFVNSAVNTHGHSNSFQLACAANYIQLQQTQMI